MAQAGCAARLLRGTVSAVLVTVLSWAVGAGLYAWLDPFGERGQAGGASSFAALLGEWTTALWWAHLVVLAVLAAVGPWTVRAPVLPRCLVGASVAGVLSVVLAAAFTDPLVALVYAQLAGLFFLSSLIAVVVVNALIMRRTLD